jgi:hypothetical protein
MDSPAGFASETGPSNASKSTVGGNGMEKNYSIDSIRQRAPKGRNVQAKVNFESNKSRYQATAKKFHTPSTFSYNAHPDMDTPVYV